MSQLNFDASNVAPASAREAIPAGWYNVMITNSDVKLTNDIEFIQCGETEMFEKLPCIQSRGDRFTHACMGS